MLLEWKPFEGIGKFALASEQFRKVVETFEVGEQVQGHAHDEDGLEEVRCCLFTPEFLFKFVLLLSANGNENDVEVLPEEIFSRSEKYAGDHSEFQIFGKREIVAFRFLFELETYKVDSSQSGGEQDRNSEDAEDKEEELDWVLDKLVKPVALYFKHSIRNN